MQDAARVLIAEDERIIALDIKNSLRNLGYGVLGIVSSGEKAIEKVAESRPDLVLMDIMLAGTMDGIEAADQIRQQYQIPIVYLTSHTDPATLARAKATAPFGYLVKPFEDRDLHTTIEMALARAKAEEEIKKALDKEKELNELKSQFVSMVSHEFRTPMATILFSAGLLETYGNKWSEDKKQTHLKRIQASVKQMTELLDIILVIGQVEANKLEFKPAPLNLEKFCHELIEDQQHLAGSNYEILFQCQGEFADVVMDEKLLRHILNNLLSNAIKYSPQGGKIRFELSAQEIEQPSGTVEKFAVFEIEDQGIGIPQAEQKNLFTTFHRASNVGTISGTGLGLAIVKKSVELHGGTITFSSEENAGTIFTVTLPVNNKIN
jgi:signal transduction histidine kinase